MALTKTQILAKWRKYQTNPEAFQAPANDEVLAIAFHIVNIVSAIEKALVQGKYQLQIEEKPFPKQEIADEILALVVKELSNKTAEITGKNTNLLDSIFAENKNNLSQLINSIKDEVKKEQTILQNRVDSFLNEKNKSINNAIKNIKNGEDGIVTDEEIQRASEIALEILKQELPNFDEEILKAITNNGEGVRDSLELLQGDERLEQSAIKNLQEDLLQLQEQIARLGMSIRGVGGGTSKNVINNVINERIADGTISSSGINTETPSGTINGSNTVFTVSNEPKYVVVNALTYFDGGGYTYSGGTITFDIPPASGSFIKSIY